MLLGSDSEVVAVDMLMMIVLTVIPDDLDFRWIAMDGTGRRREKRRCGVDTGFFAVTDEMKIMYHYLNNQIPDEPVGRRRERGMMGRKW